MFSKMLSKRVQNDAPTAPRTLDGRCWIPFFHAVLFLLFMAQLLAFFGIQGEDCYITFRYARNLAEGAGLVYNPGEYVEGISNPYWAFCLAGLYALGLSMTLACSLLVVAHALAAYALTAAASVAWFGRRSWFSLLPPLLLCAMTLLPAGYQNGLEGSAAALGVALVCLGAAGNRPAVLVAGIAVLLGNRPEAPGYAALAVCWLGVRALTAEGRARRAGLLWAEAIVALVAGMVLLRYWYYGDIVPHTMRAKGSVPFSVTFSAGMHHLGTYAWALGPWMIVLAVLGPADRGRRFGASLLLLLLFLNAAVVLRNGGDWMGYFRLLTPLFGAFALLAASGFAWCWRRRSPVFRTVLAGAFLAGVAWLGDPGMLRAMVSNWPGRVNGVLLAPDGGNYPLDNHVTGRVLGQEADDLLLAENGGWPPYLLKEVRVLEMAGLTDRSLIAEGGSCMDLATSAGVFNWDGLFIGHRLTYVQFPPPCLRARLQRLLHCPEVFPSLEPFIVAQNANLPDFGTFDVLLVRNDRAALKQFIRDYGAFVPAADMARGLQSGSAAVTDSWVDITAGPWALPPWRDTRTGGELPESWNDWLGRRRHAAEMRLDPGTTRFSRPLTDGCPLLIAVDLLPGAPEDTRLTFTRTGSGDSRTVSPAGEGFPVDACRCHYLFLPETPPGAAGELVLDAETSAECRVRVSVSRWTPGPPPALPKAHRYPDKSDCRGMIARRTLPHVALEHMTSLYLAEGDLDGLLREWDAMDPAFLSPALRHCARGLAFEKGGRLPDALEEYGVVTESETAAQWRWVPEELRDGLGQIPAWAEILFDGRHLHMAAAGRLRVLAAMGDVAGAEAAYLAVVGLAGEDYALCGVLDRLYKAHLSPAESEQRWRAVLAAHPDQVWPRYFLSLACSRALRHAEALQEARAALSLRPDNELLQTHVLVMVQKLAAEHFSQGRFAEALPLWREVGGVPGKLGEAKTLSALGDVAGAEAAHLAAVGLAGDDYTACAALDGLHRAHLSDGESALRWRALATAHPEHAWPRYFLSLACSRSLQHAEALGEARAALLLRPDNELLQTHVLVMVQKLATEHLSQGRFAECLSLWREVGGVPGKLGEARALSAMGDVAGAEAAHLAAVGLAGDDYTACAALDGLHRAHLSDGEAALRWRALAAAHPDYAWPRYFLSLACSRALRHAEALGEARAALSLHPDNELLQTHVLVMVQKLATEHLSRGRFAECLSLWREVGGVPGKLGEARALSAMGDVAGAEAAYLSVLLTTEPEAGLFDAYEGLAALYTAQCAPGERPGRWAEVVRRVPDQPWAPIYRGCALDALSRGDEAQEAYLQAAAALLGAGMQDR